MICRDGNAIRDKPRIKSRSQSGPIHDKSERKSALAPPRLRRLRHRVHLQPLGAVLVRRGRLSFADAVRRQRLPVPGLPAQGGARRERGGNVTGKWNVMSFFVFFFNDPATTERVYFE